MHRHQILTITLLLAGLANGCDQSNFSSAAKNRAATKKNTTKPTNDDDDSKAGPGTTGGTSATSPGTTGSSTSGGPTTTGATTGSSVGASTSAGTTTEGPTVDNDELPPVKKDCTVSLAYNPEDVRCNIPIGGDSIWRNIGGWNTLVGAFTDQSASWISSYDATSDHGHPMCPFVPVDKLVYVSYLTVANPGVYNVEGIIDDTGTVRLWRHSDPTKEVLVTPQNASAHGGANLEVGTYAIIVEATDTGKAATGMVLSIKGPDGQVAKRSTQDGSWCVFQVSAATDVKTFVPQAAACRACFGVK